MITGVDILPNPRQENGGFGEFRCEMCGISSGALITLSDTTDHTTVCKGCLLKWVDKIDISLLEQCKR